MTCLSGLPCPLRRVGLELRQDELLTQQAPSCPAPVNNARSRRLSDRLPSARRRRLSDRLPSARRRCLWDRPDSCTMVGVGPSAALQNCTPRGGQEGRCWTPGLLPGALGVLSEASSDSRPLRSSSCFTAVQSAQGRQFSLQVWGRVGASVGWPFPAGWYPLKTQLKSTAHHCQPAPPPQAQDP